MRHCQAAVFQPLPPGEYPPPAPVQPGRAACPEELLLSREGEARLHRLLHTLPEPYREIFTLRVFAELDFRQLGELFHKSGAWARVTFYRAKVKLQEAVRRDEHEPV